MKQLIERLRELEAAATPGPWDCAIGSTSEGCIDLLPTGNERVPSRDVDLDLIDEMRNILPQLLDRLEKLEAVAEAAKQVAGIANEALNHNDSRTWYSALDDVSYTLDSGCGALAALGEKE